MLQTSSGLIKLNTGDTSFACKSSQRCSPIHFSLPVPSENIALSLRSRTTEARYENWKKRAMCAAARYSVRRTEPLGPSRSSRVCAEGFESFRQLDGPFPYICFCRAQRTPAHQILSLHMSNHWRSAPHLRIENPFSLLHNIR
jgi:hypothetical protein